MSHPFRHLTLALMYSAVSTTAMAQEDGKTELIAPAPADVVDTIPVGPVEPAPKAEDAPVRAGNRLIEEIVITAQKREENLQDVPISVQAFSADALDARGVTSTADLPRITPSLTVSTSFGYAMTYLRGIGSDAFLFADPSVVQYVDGVYNPFGVGLVSDFGEVERIEVLKGPQGTLFGRNAIGGAISIVTRKAPLNEFAVSAQASYKDFEYWQTRASVGTPIIENVLGLSVSGIFNEGRPYTDGKVNGRSEDNNRTKGGRVKLRFAPVEWAELNLMAYKLDESSQSAQFGLNVEPFPILGAVVPRQDPYSGSLNEPIAFSVENRTYSGDLQLFTDWLDIKLLASDQYVENRQVLDFDGSPLPLVAFAAKPGRADVQTAELQLLSNDSSWGSEWLKYIFGVYYFKSDSGLEKSTFTAADLDIANRTILGFRLRNDFVDAVLDAAGGLPIPSGGVIEITGLQATKSLAYYTQATAAVTDWFSVTVGARFQEEERYVIESSAGLQLLNGNRIEYLNKSADNDPALRDKTNSFDPKLSLDFRPAWGWLGDGALIYLSAQTATKSSVYNVTNFLDVTVEKVKPEEMTAYEIGIKTRLFDNQVVLNAAAWRYDLDNVQVQFASLLNGGTVSFENAGSLRSQGVDFDTLIQLFRDHNGPVLTLGGAYVDSYYTSYPDGSGFNPATGIYSGGNDYGGNRGVRSPEFSGTATLVQSLPVPIGMIEIGADYYYSTKLYYLAQNSPQSEQKAYGLLGAHLSLLVDAWGLRVTAFGTNMTNAKYTNGLFITDFGVNDTRAPKSVYGIRLNYDFH